MPYPLPAGVADLGLQGSYTTPVGVVDLDIGSDAISPNDRAAAIAGETMAPTGAIRGRYDPYMLSAVHRVSAEKWQPGSPTAQDIEDAFQSGPPVSSATESFWGPSDALSSSPRSWWQAPHRETHSSSIVWQEATLATLARRSWWGPADFIPVSAVSVWQEGATVILHRRNGWQPGVRYDLDWQTRWQAGGLLHRSLIEPWQPGMPLNRGIIEVWQHAGYPGPYRPGPVIPVPIWTPWGTDLCITRSLPGTALLIGRGSCVLIANHQIAVQRSYMSINSASLVRWPDLVPLPCTSMTIETDFDSWCWALSATLAGADAYALVQPNPLACEVLATINGQQWKFLLDVPSTTRAFNSDRVTLKGRSRSAWLHSPYTPARSFTEANAREMVQLAEAALDNTGWTIDWQIPNWLVPAGRYQSWNTPMGALIRLVNTTDDGLYTDPLLEIITAQPRWPVASWLIDAEVADVLIPEAAIITLSQAPLYTQPINAVYVSGESHGVLGFVKIAGTDGALQPSDPIVNELLCDAAGVAARQRGLNALSDSGAGFTMDAETLFNPLASPAFPLVPPGLIVSIAGMMGVSRAIRVSANWSNDGLQVKQAIGLERRESE